MASRNVHVVVNNIGKVIAAVSGDQLMRAAKAGGFVIEAQAKINANDVFSGKATNTLAGSIQTVEAESSGTSAYVDVGPTVVYGRIHEFGGVIKPVFAKALHFVIDGVHVVTQIVHMPARPYLRPAVDESQDKILDAVRFQLQGLIEAATG